MNSARALEKVQKENAKLLSLYRKAKKRQYEVLFEDVEHGHKLKEFIRTINRFGLDDAENLMDYLDTEIANWLGNAPKHFRESALEVINARIARVRERAGLMPFDDPMPGDDDNVSITCKRVLGL